MTRRSTIATLLAVAATAPAVAEEAGPPPPGLAVKTAPPEVALAAPPPPPKAAPPSDDRPRPTKIGSHRSVTAAQLGKGAWLKASPPLWRLALRSKGAKALRVHFQQFNVAAGRLWVHNGKEWFGPYSGRGIYNDGDFWTHLVPGERLVLEYQPAGAPAKLPKTPPFTIEAVAHLDSNPLE